jgi:hypothetical protein
MDRTVQSHLAGIGAQARQAKSLRLGHVLQSPMHSHPGLLVLFYLEQMSGLFRLQTLPGLLAHHMLGLLGARKP